MQTDVSSSDSLSTSSTFVSDEPHPQEVASELHSKLRILIVDDQAIDRSLLRILLEQRTEFEIVGEARDGEEAVVQAELYRPDVILMDVHLPRVNGVEATRRISRSLPNAAIVGISSQYSPHAYNAMIAAGAAAFVLKEDAVGAIYKTIQFSLRTKPNRVHQSFSI